MKHSKTNWVDFWNRQTFFFNEVIDRKNTEIFLRETNPIMNYNREDVILDIGCGPGNLAEYLKDKVKEIHCVDTSSRYIEMCNKKFKNDNNVFCYTLSNDYLNFNFLLPNRFSKIICLSVIQYYNDINEVKKLILKVKSIVQFSAKFLIADIPFETNILKEILGALKTGVKEKILLETLQLLWRARWSEYYQIRKKRGLLILKERDIQKIINNLNVKVELLNQRLTLNENRKHLLVYYF